MRKTVLGIEINETSVRAVLLTLAIKGHRLMAWADVPLDTEAVNTDLDTLKAAFEQGLLQALTQIKAQSKLVPLECRVTLPISLISLRRIAVPFKGTKKISQVLPFELEPLLPFPIDTLMIDYQIVHSSPSAKETGLIAATVATSRVSPYLEGLASHKLKVTSMTLEGYALAQSLTSRKDLPQEWLLVHFAEKNCTAFFVRQKAVQAMRSFPKGAEAKRASRIGLLLRQMILTQTEISTVLCDPQIVWLSGDGAEDPNLRDLLSRYLELPVKGLNLAGELNIALPLDRHGPEWRPEQMDNVLSAALYEPRGAQGINFIRNGWGVLKYVFEYKAGLMHLCILLLLIIGLSGFRLHWENRGLQGQVRELDRQIREIFTTTFPEVKRIVDPLTQMKNKLNEVQSDRYLTADQENRLLSIDLLNTISQEIPRSIDAEFTRLVIDSQSIMISGHTDTFNSVDAIKLHLEATSLIKKVTISSANLDRTGKRVRFKLKVQA